MTTYADLLYEAAETLRQLRLRLPQDRTRREVDPLLTVMVAQEEKIREALRTRPAAPVLSTEYVERILKSHDPEVGNHIDIEDVKELVASHEAMRRERDTVNSIAERFDAGWTNDEDGKWYLGGSTPDEPMTSDQIAWFEARA